MNQLQNERAYVLDWRKLETCDIILSRVTWSIDALIKPIRLANVAISRLIRMKSSDYSHAMLYFGGTIIHAQPPMVFAANPQRFFCANAEDYCCLRHTGLTAQEKQKIEEDVRVKVGALYSIHEALKTPRKKDCNEHSSSGEQFCSRLVAQAYEAAGIQLVNNPDYCAPGDFLNSAVLTKIGPCARSASELDLRIGGFQDLPLLSQKRAYDWLKKVQRIALEDGFKIENLNSIFAYVLKYSNRDAEVDQYLVESQYLETWKDDAAAHVYRYIPSIWKEVVAEQPMVAMDEACGLFDCTGRYGDALLQLEPIEQGTKTIARMAEFYREMITDIERRIVFLVRYSAGNPSAIPLMQLFSICSTLVSGSYTSNFAGNISTVTQKLKKNWMQCVSANLQNLSP